MNYWWARSARTRKQLFPHTQTSSPQTLNIQVCSVFIGAAVRKPSSQCLLKLPVLLAALLSQCSFQEAAGALWGCWAGEWSRTGTGAGCRGHWSSQPGQQCRWALLSSVLQGMSACQEGFPQQLPVLLSNRLCFGGDTQMCALTGVSENTGLASGARSKEFSLCYLRSGNSVLWENAWLCWEALAKANFKCKFV